VIRHQVETTNARVLITHLLLPQALSLTKPMIPFFVPLMEH